MKCPKCDTDSPANHEQSQSGYLNTKMAIEKVISTRPKNSFTSSEIRREVECILGRSVPANTIRAYIYMLKKKNVIRSVSTIDFHSPLGITVYERVVRRIAGDRRFGTNPKGYNGPEKRSIFDRRSYYERRRKKIES